MFVSCSYLNFPKLSSLMTPANGTCGGAPVGYSPWTPAQHQYVENFYNNPIQYPTNGSATNVHHFSNHQQPMPNTNGTSCYPQHQQTTKSCHSHYPSNHAHSIEYQSYHPNNGINRKCGNTGRMCSSYDALTSPQQPLLPNPANWGNGQPKTNNSHHKCGGGGGGGSGGTTTTTGIKQQNSQQQLYQCTSECSDHSLKSHSQHSQHSQHSHSSQERCKNSNCKENCHHQRSQQTNNKHHQHTHSSNSKTANNCTTTNGNDILNGNDNIYENDDETTEHDRMITSASDCCSSTGEIDGDSCCSCSLYAEADDPATTATTQSAPTNNQIAKVSAQN